MLAGQIPGEFQTIPTVRFSLACVLLTKWQMGSDVKQFSADGVTMKCWDLGGQVKFRSGWQRYARGCDVVIYVVDGADVSAFASGSMYNHNITTV